MAFYWPSVSEAEGLPHLMLKYEPHAHSSVHGGPHHSSLILSAITTIAEVSFTCVFTAHSTPFSTMYDICTPYHKIIEKATCLYDCSLGKQEAAKRVGVGLQRG